MRSHSFKLILLAIVFSLNCQAQIGAAFKNKLNAVKEKLSGKWEKTYELDTSGKEADMVVRVGDMDNFGYGWPDNFNPLSGQSTPEHQYPYYPEGNDPEGTDRIMVVSSFNYDNRFLGNDGYAGNTSRPANIPKPITLNYDLKNIKLTAATIQVFMDDVQPMGFSSRFIVKLNGVRLDNFEKVINNFNQHGPIGKLVSVSILPEYLPLLKEGKVELFFDDPYTGAGDGFAIDFVRLLINPKNAENFGTVTGTVIDGVTSKPMEGAIVNANGLVTINTDKEGKFTLTKVQAGLTTVSASKMDYEAASETFDLYSEQTKSIIIRLKKKVESTSTIESQLKQKGKIALYGIYFDVAKATIKPESEKVLLELSQALKNGAYKKVIVSGHTDSDGEDSYNLDLSNKRAEAVKKWLVSKGLSQDVIVSIGFGESRPIAGNFSDEGKSQNRRVEVEIGE
jgi:OOP family OmpA-OmpF porin